LIVAPSSRLLMSLRMIAPSSLHTIKQFSQCTLRDNLSFLAVTSPEYSVFQFPNLLLELPDILR
jgi:hypothetical protein